MVLRADRKAIVQRNRLKSARAQVYDTYTVVPVSPGVVAAEDEYFPCVQCRGTRSIQRVQATDRYQ